MNPINRVEVELIVDTGATYTVIPTSILNRLGINPTRTVKARLADNRVIEKPMGEVASKWRAIEHPQHSQYSGTKESTCWVV